MTYHYLLLAIADKVATITIRRPDKGNALVPIARSCFASSRSSPQSAARPSPVVSTSP